MEVKTTCPYCGVGCGVLASVDDAGRVAVKGDPGHPANYGRLCSKGAALAETMDLEERLLAPEIHGQPAGWDAALDHVGKGFSRVIEQHGPGAVAFYVSGQLLTEDYYVVNKLSKGFIGSANIDTNSRLCMASAVAGHKRAFGADTVPCSYEDLERAKLIVLAGSNTAWCHPVIYQRIVQAKRDNPDLFVVVIDPRRTASCDIADLHLALRPGTDAILFNGLLVYLDQAGERHLLFTRDHTEGLEAALAAAHASVPAVDTVAARCGLDPAALAEFYRLFARTERVVTVFSQGINQSSSGTDKVNGIINCHLFTGRIGRPGMGPFSITGQPNAMGGREVGGLANQLAAHMELENPQHRALVQRFWQAPAIAAEPGLKAVDLFRAVGESRVKAVWIMATNPAVSLPDTTRVREALAQCELVVVSDCERRTDTSAYAHVLLPAQTWGEREGTVTNSERRISRQRAFLPSPGEARPDWWIVTQVARRMGFADGFGYKRAADIFREHAALSGFENRGTRDFDISGLARLADRQYEALAPVQWPVSGDPAQGTPRMFSDGRFFTASGRARFVAVTPREAANPTDEAYPLVLNTGRIRDQWHTMTRTGKSARLFGHIVEPYAELHPRDAAPAGIEDGMVVTLSSRWGASTVRARVSDEQQPGSVFVPMHWNDQFGSSGPVDALVNPVTDPISGEPEFKHTPVRVEPAQVSWYGFLLSRRRLAINDASYWACARGDGLWRYELAGEQAPQDWAKAARALLCTEEEHVDWIEYFDRAAMRYRAGRLVGGRLESCIFIGPSHVLPPRDWLAGLFGDARLDSGARANLLTGRAGQGQPDAGRIVCACFSVGLHTIEQAVREGGLTTPEAVGAALKAGTNCGSCLPEIKGLLAETAGPTNLRRSQPARS